MTVVLAQPDFRVLAEGLSFPEGPIALPDGSILVVELGAGRLTRIWGEGRKETVAELGGGPNGAAIGLDRAVYVVNNGGFTWITGADGEPALSDALPPDYQGGWIDRVELPSGRVDRLYERVGDRRLSGPNDIVFDRTGHFWFTDTGRCHGNWRDHGGLYYAAPDGSAVREIHHAGAMFNGIGLSPDETTLYTAVTDWARLLAIPICEPGVLAFDDAILGGMPVAGVAAAPGWFDSLAVQADGHVCVATLLPGGITTFAPDGSARFVPLPDPFVTNICFGGADLSTAFVTCSGSGRLIALKWPDAGLKLNFQDTARQ